MELVDLIPLLYSKLPVPKFPFLRTGRCKWYTGLRSTTTDSKLPVHMTPRCVGTQDYRLLANLEPFR